jgi:hypothetical protein
MIFLKDMDEQGAVALGHPDIRVSTLHGNEFAVPGSAYGVHKRPQINAMAIDVVKLYSAAMQSVLIDGREDLFRQLKRDINSNSFFVPGGIGDPDVQPPVMVGDSRNLAGTVFRSVLGTGGYR